MEREQARSTRQTISALRRPLLTASDFEWACSSSYRCVQSDARCSLVARRRNLEMRASHGQEVRLPLVQKQTKLDSMNVSVHGAKTQLSKLLDLVEDGETVVIERHGRAVAQLVPVRKRRISPLGAMRGQFAMTEGWERALTDEEAEAFWHGR